MKLKATMLSLLMAWSAVGLAQELPKPDREGRLGLELPPSRSINQLKAAMNATSTSNREVIEPSAMPFGGAAWTGVHYNPGSVLRATGDINGDGKADMIDTFVNLPNLGTSDLEDFIPFTILVYLNGLSSPSQTLTDYYAIWPIGDVDGDGRNDAIVRTSQTSFEFELLFGSSTGYESEGLVFTLNNNISTVTSGDFTRDGVQDVFVNMLPSPAGMSQQVLLVGDLDREEIGLTDIFALPGNTITPRALYRNDTQLDYLARFTSSVDTGTMILEIGHFDEDLDWVVDQVRDTQNFLATPSLFEFADINGDGEKDAVFRNFNGYFVFFANVPDDNGANEAEQNNGLFNEINSLLVTATAQSITLHPDLTGDGSDDFVFATGGDINIVNGSDAIDGIDSSDFIPVTYNGPAFTQAPSFANNATGTGVTTSAFGDVSGNGKSDLIIGRVDVWQQIYDYAAVSEISASGVTAVSLNPPFPQFQRELMYNANAGDWDGDGIDDYGYAVNEPGVEAFYRINLSGGGSLTFDFGPNRTFFGIPAFADVDGDGLPEMILRVQRSENNATVQYVEVYSSSSTNPTVASFSEKASDLMPFAPDAFPNGFYNIGDVTGDGKDDVVASMAGSPNNFGILLSANANDELVLNVLPNTQLNTAVNIGDINFDGIDDFAVNNFMTQSVDIYYGSDSFSNGAQLISQMSYTYGSNVAGSGFASGFVSAFGFRLAAGDFTGNGHKDLVIGAFQSRDMAGSTNGDYILWVFKGYGDGFSYYPTQAFKLAADDLDPLRTVVNPMGSYMWIHGNIQTLSDINGDGSDELLVQTYASLLGSNALILLGGVDLDFGMYKKYAEEDVTVTPFRGYEFGEYSVLLEAPNRSVGLGLPANFINISYTVAFGDFDGDGIPELWMPQIDRNFSSTPVYKYELDVEQRPVPDVIEITMIEDVENDQGGWVRIHVDGLAFQIFGDWHPEWSVWRKNMSGNWVHVSTISPIRNGAKYAEVPVPRTLPTGDDPDDTNSFMFMVTTFWGEIESNEMRGWALDNIAPNRITGVQAASLTDVVSMSWNPSNAHDLRNYQVFQWTDGAYNPNNPLITTTEVDAEINKNLLTGTEVQLVVVAVDIHNNASVPSNPVALDVITSNEDLGLGLPSDFALQQNYPNPFNPSTTVKFDLPKASHVKLEVFDMLGRKVATMVNQQMNAGYHTVTFDAQRMASGVYIYRMETDNGFLMTRKMTLVK